MCVRDDRSLSRPSFVSLSLLLGQTGQAPQQVAVQRAGGGRHDAEKERGRGGQKHGTTVERARQERGCKRRPPPSVLPPRPLIGPHARLALPASPPTRKNGARTHRGLWRSGQAVCLLSVWVAVAAPRANVWRVCVCVCEREWGRKPGGRNDEKKGGRRVNGQTSAPPFASLRRPRNFPPPLPPH